MATSLLNGLDHYCFRSPVLNLHKHPDLHRCDRGNAHAALEQSTTPHVKQHSDPTVDCPACNELAQAMAAGATPCTISVHIDMARKAGLVDEKGAVTCPQCGGSMTLVPGKHIAEVHAKLCTDPCIHYPDLHKAGKLSDEYFNAWKATLTRNELLGHYWRVPEQHIVATFSHEETALIDTDRDAFNQLMQNRMRERAEAALLHQVPHRHKTTKQSVVL